MANNLENSTSNITFNNDTYIDSSGYYDFNNPFDKLSVRVLFIICYAVVFSLCICGNSMVLFAIARSPRLRSMTNFLLGNLAIADFCVGAFCVLPNLSTFLQPNWILGKVMCKIYYYIWNVSYISSIIILTVIATERYIAILHPLKARHFMTSKRLVFVQAIIWFVSLIYNIPFLIFYDTISFSESGKEYCYSSFEHMESLKWMSLLNLIIWYVIPLLLIGFMYYRVARALWQTTIASALRLQPHSNADEVSFHRTSTRLSNVNNETCPKETLNKTEPPSANASDDNSDKLQIQQWSSDDSHNSEKAVFTYKGNHEFTVVYSLRQNGEASPYKLRCFFPTTQSEANDEEMTVKLSNIKGEMSTSNPTGSSFRHGKHRQTYLASSSRVAKARKKVIRLLIAVVISFCICVLPHMLKVLNHYWVVFNLPHDVETILSPISFIVLYLNSVLNPFMYAMFSTNFRRSFKETLPCFHQRKRSTEQGIK